jgi:hypothetical protein
LSLSSDGTHNLVCTASDGAGNSGAAPGSANTAAVKIDATPPAVTITTPADNADYYLFSTVASSYGCSDATSGVNTCSGPAPSGSNIDTSTVGTKTFTVTATDVAGNVTVKTHTYRVSYQVTLQPLKTPAQQGSAVPVVWQTKDGLGRVISSLGSVLKIESVFNGAAPASGCVASAAGTRETLYQFPDGATGKSSLRFITTSQSFQFNWDTTTTSTAPIITGKGCYTVLIYLDDRPELPLANPRMTTAVQLK